MGRDAAPTPSLLFPPPQQPHLPLFSFISPLLPHYLTAALSTSPLSLSSLSFVRSSRWRRTPMAVALFALATGFGSRFHTNSGIALLVSRCCICGSLLRRATAKTLAQFGASSSVDLFSLTRSGEQSFIASCTVRTLAPTSYSTCTACLLDCLYVICSCQLF